MPEKGIRTFFFGKRRKVKQLKSPFVYKSVTDNFKDNKSPLAFIKHCDYYSIFDEESLTCVGRNTSRGKQLAKHRLYKYINSFLDSSEVLGLWQFQNNCWFNSLLMCLFFSDNLRVIMNSLRLRWISSSSTNKNKVKLYNIFTYMMEIPHYNKDIINTIDSNMILSLLHKFQPTMFDHPGYDGGSGILYCKKLLRFLGLKDYMEIRLISLEKQRLIYVELNDNAIAKLNDDITYTDLLKYIVSLIKSFNGTIKILALYIDIKPSFVIPIKIHNMTLESMYVSNYKSNNGIDKHAVAGIICNKQMCLYDGERAALNKTLKQYDWKNENSKSFAMTYNTTSNMIFNFSKSNRVAFFVTKQ